MDQQFPINLLLRGALRHPLSIPRFLASRLAYRSNTKHSNRVGRVSSATRSEFLASVVPSSTLPTAAEMIEASVRIHEASLKIYDAYASRIKTQIGFDVSGILEADAEMLYAITRARRPHFVVETGVSDGLSSLAILLALQRNDSGMLHSIDYPDIGAPLLIDRPPGWVILGELRPRWKTHFGTSRRLLGPLLNELSSIDVFFHDSEHSYTNMLFEFGQASSHMEAGGLILSDDARSNDALIEAALSEHSEPIFSEGRIGGFVKTVAKK